ncbi:MAG: AAA family ATPase [Erysipelotrichaceae bacterium]|nr:AAA family ATPase [Erysipelotrichaceae bacterium]
MFLKRIELSGFKSFANKTILTMDEGVTGIVGPNGCGKSNINDAIRWVLGEQSSKSLRSGSSLSEIIFSGSETRRPVNVAKVSLVFDNSAHVFDSPFEEIEITREIKRDGESNCYINKVPCRLKDISDLVMDTGLGRDSLSIITQGNISSFADAKPEERRLLFEEAAGVAKYKKRKKTSLAKLEAMAANLERVQDTLDSLEEQKESLEDQAAKAREYLTCRDELASIEISVLADQIEGWQKHIARLESELEVLNLEKAQNNTDLVQKEEHLDQIRHQMFELDQQLSSLQSEYTRLMEESYSLQKRKTALDEKRKYALEKADAKSRLASVRELTAEAKYEYEDRRNRLQVLQEKNRVQEEELQKTQREIQEFQKKLNNRQSLLQAHQNRRLIVENKLASPYAHKQGIQAVMKARNSLDGIEGVISELLEGQPGYEQAVSTALGSANDQIATRDDECARRAIGFLKHARAGRATFLPLNVCKPRSLYPDQQLIAEQSAGCLGLAKDFVQVPDKYRNLRDRLLGNIIVADNLEHASEIAKRLRHAVKIVTLDGDVIHAGGAMSGGSSKNSAFSTAGLKSELKELKEQCEKESADVFRLQQAIRQKNDLLAGQRESQMQARIDMEKLAGIVDVKRDKYESLQDQMKSLQESAEEVPDEMAEDSLVVQLSELHSKMDEANSQISLKRGRRMEQAQAAEDLEKEVRQLRRTMNASSNAIHEKELDKTRTETRIEQALMRLNSEYSLTFEAAAGMKKEDLDLEQAQARIKTLRAQLSRLKDVNLKAPAQFEEVMEKYEFLYRQKEELEAAAGQIRDAIAQMDETMKIQFKEMFDKINGELDGIFKAMFGGGRAKLSLEDPEDLLNTGVDIDVQPPGKMVKNIQTFSGGEKALIAISVLFAILKARTMPLCIFDEVEAALDQANVERFARYLSHFKDQSQFVVVTHRPGTMEQCDSLYGITMQQDGVSTVLKVQLKDAVHLTEGRE